jgi:CheY-like chemotaxis protein
MKHTILLADDSVTIQKVVELTFLDEDVQIVSVGNGSDAITRLADLRPDLILADVHMPGADGYEVCQTARRMQPGVPVLLLVGTFEIFDPPRAAEVGASGHMKKPFDSQELLRRVRELLAAGRTSTAAPAPALTEPLPALRFEPPAWEPEEPAAPAAAPAAPSDEVESWSFEPVGEPGVEGAPEGGLEPAVEAEAVAPAANESWSAFATSRFEMKPALADVSIEPEPQVEPIASELATPVAAAAPVLTAPSVAAPLALSDADLERIAQRVVELLSERTVKDVAWEVVPDLAEVLLKARIRELEAAVE